MHSNHFGACATLTHVCPSLASPYKATSSPSPPHTTHRRKPWRKEVDSSTQSNKQPLNWLYTMSASPSSSCSSFVVVPLLCLLAGAAAGAAAMATAAGAASGSCYTARLKDGKEIEEEKQELQQHTQNKEARGGANEAAAAAAAAVAAEAASILSLWFDGGHNIESNYRHRWFCAPGSERQLAFDEEVSTRASSLPPSLPPSPLTALTPTTIFLSRISLPSSPPFLP